MKIRFRKVFLLPLALGLCVSSCKDNDSKVATKVEEKLLVPKATPVERAEALGAVAMIPAGSSAVLSVYDIDGVARDAQSTYVGNIIANMCGGKCTNNAVEGAVSAEIEVDPKLLMEGEIKDVTVAGEEAAPSVPDGVVDGGLPVKNVVISLGSEQPEFMTQITPVLEAIYTFIYSSSLTSMGQVYLKEGDSKTQFVDSMKGFMEKNLSGSMVKLLGELDFSPSKGTAPFLAIATLSPDAKVQVEQGLVPVCGMASMFTQGMVTPHSVKAAGLDFKGVVIDGKVCSKAFDQVIASQKDDAIKAILNKTKEKLQTVKLYVLMALKGNQLISVICTNPEQQIRLAANPSESVLAQDDFSFVDAHLKSNISGLAYTSPSMIKAGNALSNASTEASLKGYSEGLRQLAVPFGASPEVVEAVCSAVGRVSSSYAKLVVMNDMSVASGVVAWKSDDGVKIAMTSGLNSGIDLNPEGSLSGVNSKALPGSALTGYGAVTPELMNLGCSMIEDSGIAAWKVATAMMDSPNANIPSEFREGYEKVKSVESEIGKVWESVGLYVAAISGKRAVAINLNDEAKKGVASISFVERLKDRKKLDESWLVFKRAANDASPKLKLPLLFDGKVVSGQEGNARWFEMESKCPYFQPVVVVDDSLLVYGSSLDWNQSVFKAASAFQMGSAPTLAMYVHIPSWTRWVSDCVRASGKDKGKEVLYILDALSRDVEAIEYSASKEGNQMIQLIEFKKAQ